jgi:cytochrome c-type biogenesis protein CcmH
MARLLATRGAWALLAVALAGLLAFGSVHPRRDPATARIAHLEAVIKCPSCDDLSIAQSDAPSAMALRAAVAHWVREGLSDAEIERIVVARYGPAELLAPPREGLDALVWVLPAVALGAGLAALAALGWRRQRVGGGRGPGALSGRPGAEDERLVARALGER